MRRIQIHMDDELDEAAASEAARRGMSKAALIRACVAREVRPGASAGAGAWEQIIGWRGDDPVEDIDEAVYGPKCSPVELRTRLLMQASNPSRDVDGHVANVSVVP